MAMSTLQDKGSTKKRYDISQKSEYFKEVEAS
jgi:hypothetical protein